MRPRYSFFRAILCACLVILFAASAPLARAQAYVGKPKLIVLVVIDQFRGDYLNRWRDEFKGRGFNLFMKDGAWFTDCYYDYANTKTAPGHSTIGTGAYTDGHGIESNEWWDATRSNTAKVSSVEDERYALVGLPADSQTIPANRPGAPGNALKYAIGSSPRNLRATTFSDELRLATQGKSRAYGISLKDRAAILPVGQAANGAFWIDPPSGLYVTSTYYMKSLPKWAADFNNGPRRLQALKDASADDSAQLFYELVGHTPAANSYELDFAKALIRGEKLGQSGVTDFVSISLSPNDIMGHQFGPDSDQEHDMVLSLDRDLDNFFTWLDQNIGLDNVWVALTADHGVAPIPGEAAKLGIHATNIDSPLLYEHLNAKLDDHFRHTARPAGATPKPGPDGDFLMPGPELPYLVLNKQAFEKLHIDEKEAEDYLADILPGEVDALTQQPKKSAYPLQAPLPTAPHARAVYTRLQLATGEYPQNEFGHLLSHSYAEHGNWYDMLVLDAYELESTGMFSGTTHFSPYSYDRHVPLGFYGAPFQPGEYHNLVAPVDIAVTWSSLAGVNRPSAAVGRVLTEALKPVTHE